MPGSIDRRAAIRQVSALLGGAALVGGGALWSACVTDRAREQAAAQGAGDFTPDDIALLDEVAETILPETSTPGARAAKVGAFMALMVTDTYTAADHRIFRAGMRQLAAGPEPFLRAGAAARLARLEALDREQKAYMDGKADGKPAHFFRMMKELALLGYFTSEIGYTRAMRYVEAPGRFDPCAPHAPGEASWAPHA
jgi:hypothetical protein